MANVKTLVSGVVTLIVGIIIIFLIVGNTSADLTTASGNISGSGLPLASLFASNGVVLLIFMAGILITIVGMALKGGK